MTDQELIALVTELAPVEPLTKGWLQAVIVLSKAVDTDPAFVAIRSRSVRNIHGTHNLLTPFVSQKMLHYARYTNNPEAAVAWLRRIPELLQQKGDGGALKIVYGVVCEESIRLSEDIVLMPISQLPPSSALERFIAMHDRSFGEPGLHGIVIPPSAALYRRGVIESLGTAADVPYTTPPAVSWFRELDVAALLLALIPNCVPLEAAHWFNYDDLDVEMLCQLGISRRGSESFPPGRLVQPPQVTPESVAGLLPDYYALDKKGKDRLELALHRLIRSRCHLAPGDRAIDLAIALEVLFMNADRDEHAHKIATRVARLVRTSLDDRHIAFTQVKRLYDLRSSMVHNGSAKDSCNVNGVKVSASELVDAVDLLCVAAMRKFLEARRLRDQGDWWNIELA